MALSTDKYGYLADPLFSFLNEVGLPLKGGYIIACQAGTSTNVATYSDWSGEAFNPVKIPLDAAGRMVNPAIVSKTYLYKILICDADHGEENPVKTIDKVAVAGSSVEFTGPVTQGLNSAESTSGFVKVTVADNKLKIEDKEDFSALNSRITAIENFLNGKKFLLADDQ